MADPVGSSKGIVSNIQSFILERTSLNSQEREDVSGRLFKVYKQARSVFMKQPTEELSSHIATICLLYAQAVVYSNRGMEESAHILENALHGLIQPKLFLNIVEKSELLSGVKDVSLEETSLNILKERNVKDLSKEDSQRAFLIAKTLRWLGHSYQNLDEYDDKKYLSLFEMIYGLAKEILLNLPQSGEVKWEQVQLRYNSEEFLDDLRGEESSEKTCAMLAELVKELDPADTSIKTQVFRAQLHNKRAIVLRDECEPKEGKEEWLRERFQETSTAYEIAKSTPQFPLFFKLLFLNNKARCAFDCVTEEVAVATMEEIESWVQLVCQMIEEDKGSHFYYSSCYQLASSVCEKMKNISGASSYLEKALAVCKKFPESSDDVIRKIENQKAHLTTL